MKKVQSSISFFLVLSVFVFVRCASADERGMAVFLDACRVLDKSHSPINSISLELDRSVSFPSPSEDLIQKKSASIQTNHQAYLKQITNPETKARMEKILSLENTIATVRDNFANGHKARIRILILNGKNDTKMKMDLSEYDFGMKKWSQNSTVLYDTPLSPSHPKFRNRFLRWYGERREAFLSTEGSPELNCQLFGRVQGAYANVIFQMCPFASQEETVKFIEQEVGLPRIANDSVSYDHGGNASKIEFLKNGKLVANMLIDASRGYICPLLQIYNPKTNKLQEEYLSQNYFLHEQSGLWFPARCTEKTFDAQTGKLTSTTENQINPTTLLVNQPVSPNEFAVDIVEGSLVKDQTQRQHRRYRAENAGVLSLASGGFDFDKMSWLHDESEQYVPSHGGVGGIVRWVLVISGIALIALAVLLIFFKHRTKTIIPLLLFALFLSCTPSSSIHELNVHVSSRILDFGEVRSSSEPVKLNFTLSNTGNVPVRVQEITSGCGCTVVEPPQNVLPAGTEIVVPVKVNVWGRYGDFENTVHIKTDASYTPIPIHIRGKIITDIWFKAHSLRCTALPDKPAATVLDVHTVDYPDVAFDFSGIDKSITVKEISRVTKDDETTIKFDVTVDMSGQDSVVTSLTLTPTDPNIAPLTVPIYCYRGSGEPTLAPELQTKAIALGTVTDSKHEVLIYGDTDLISVIKQSEFIGLPEGVFVQILPSAESSVLHLLFQFSDTKSQLADQAIEGNVELTTAGKREWSIPVSGLLRQRNNIQDVSQIK